MVAHGLLVRPGCSTYRRDGDDVGSTAFVGGPGSRARPVPGLADLRGAPLFVSAPPPTGGGRRGSVVAAFFIPPSVGSHVCV